MAQVQKGTLFVKYETQQVTEKFTKREFVLEIGDQYKEYPKFQLVNDKCALLDNIEIGQEINVSFNLKGKPYQNKQNETVYFTNLDAWKIEKVGTQTAQTQKTQSAPPPQVQVQDNNENTDDLPF